MEQKRNNYIDAIRGFAVILVVVGHCIQFGLGTQWLYAESYYDNTLFKIIYAFHMPLFAVISGFLFYGSVLRSRADTLVFNKLRSLGVPIISWTIINLLLRCVFHKMEVDGLKAIIREILYGVVDNFWFLWALLYCSLVMAAVHFWAKDSKIIIIGIMISFFVLPDVMNLQYFKYIFPFFYSGYMWNKYSGSDFYNKVRIKEKVILLGVCILIFLLLMGFFTKNCYIYTTGIQIIGKGNMKEQIIIDAYRWIVGGVGCLSVLVFFDLILNAYPIDNRVLIAFGKQSLEIYVLNGLINIFFLQIFFKEAYYSPVLIVCETAIVLSMCCLASWAIQQCSILNMLLLGRRRMEHERNQ